LILVLLYAKYLDKKYFPSKICAVQVLISGHPPSRQLQDLFNIGPTQDMDEFIKGKAIRLEQFYQGSRN
jgi:hypothetical protein